MKAAELRPFLNRRVSILWHDANKSRVSWVMADEDDDTSPIIESIGFLERVTAKDARLVMGLEVSDDEHDWSDLLGPAIIPLGMIAEIRELRFYDGR